MQVSLVIPTLNAGSLLREVLEAVDRQHGSDRLERIAIDSGSTDGTREMLQQHGFAIEVIDKSQFNHGATRDRAIEKASGEIVLLLTQDATPAGEQWLSKLVACYEDPQVGAAYCRQLPRPDCNPFIKRRLEEWTAGKNERVIQRLEGRKRMSDLEPMERLQLCAYDNVAGSVRKEAWSAHRFGHRRFGEDVAFGKSLIEAGRSIVFEPGSTVIHSHNRSPREEGKRIYCDHQNLRELFDVHLVPDRATLRQNLGWSRKHYVEVVDELGLPEGERAELRRWARSYATWAAYGMYLGANSSRLMSGPLGPLFRSIDRWMHRGI